MAYVLRFVQRFRAEDAAFMALEARFAALERRKAWTEVYEVLDFPETRGTGHRRAS